MRKFAGVLLFLGLLGLAGALALAQAQEEFASLKIEEATLRFRSDGSASLLIKGQFTLGENSNGLDPLNEGDPALTFNLTGPGGTIFKEVQTASFKARSVPGQLYASTPTEGKEGNTPGPLRVRLIAPTERKPFWRFELRGHQLRGASRASRQEFNLTIYDDTSGDVEIELTVRTPRFARRGVDLPVIMPVQLLPGGLGARFSAAGMGIARIRVQIFSLDGAKLFDQETLGNTLIFDGLTARGSPLANGVYLYVAMAIDSTGRVAGYKVGKLAILR